MRVLLLLPLVGACSLSVDYTGTLFQCGPEGECPDGYTCNASNLCLPNEAPTVTCARQVAVGGKHSCTVRDDGTVWCWGANQSGQLGEGSTTDQTAPVQVT